LGKAYTYLRSCNVFDMICLRVKSFYVTRAFCRRCSTNAVQNTQVTHPIQVSSRVQSVSKFCVQLYNTITGEVQRQEVHNAFQTTHSELKFALQQSADQHKIREELFEATRKERDLKMGEWQQAQMRSAVVARNSEATVDEKHAAFQSVVDCMIAVDRVAVSAESAKSCREADEYLRHKFNEWKDAYSRKNDEDKRFHDRSRMMALVVGPVVTLLSFAGTAAFQYARQPAPIQEQLAKAQMQTHEQWLCRLEQQNKRQEEVITKMLAQHKADLEQLQKTKPPQTSSWWSWGSLAGMGVGAVLGKSFG